LWNKLEIFSKDHSISLSPTSSKKGEGSLSRVLLQRSLALAKIHKHKPFNESTRKSPAYITYIHNSMTINTDLNDIQEETLLFFQIQIIPHLPIGEEIETLRVAAHLLGLVRMKKGNSSLLIDPEIPFIIFLKVCF
jgi:hypothetical protein